MVPLEASNLFRELSPAEMEHLTHVAKELQVPAQHIFFREGEPGTGLYVIKEGVVQIATTVAHGDARVLSRLGPGEHFGEMAIVDNEPRSATAQAEEPATVYFVSQADLLCMLERTPRLARVLVRQISLRLRDFNQQYIREVLESERLALVGRFASSIVHDLKNPLNVIGLSAEICTLPTANAELREVSRDRIVKQVERISSMVNELLEFARGSHVPVVLAQVEYPRFIGQLVSDLRLELEPKSIALELENAPPCVTVRINPPRLARVFHNFVCNASDAMPSGGKIVIRFRVEGKELVTEVQDSGPGIAPEIADRLFQAFASFGKANGTGLGLSISKKIIQDHQGRIFARNAATGGAVFGFSLPFEVI